MSTSTLTVLEEADKLSPTAIIAVYIVDASSIGGGLLRYSNEAKSGGGDIVWQGNTYTRFPLEVTGFGMRIKGEPYRPHVKFSNIFGTFTALNLQYQDLVRAKFIRKRFWYKNLDGQPEADPNAHFPDDVFYFDRLVSQNKLFVEYELLSATEIDQIQLPRRQVFSNLCIHKYRGEGCMYSGKPVALRDGTLLTASGADKGQYSSLTVFNAGDWCFKYLEGTRKQVYLAKIGPFSNIEPPESTHWDVDECSKRLADGCKPRFGKGAPGQKSDFSLPMGAFPGSRLIGGVSG